MQQSKEEIMSRQAWIKGEQTTDFEKHYTQEFCGEKELCDYIEDNIKELTKSLFEENYRAHKREYCLGLTRLRVNIRRADFMIATDESNILVECKSPTYKSGLTKAVAQLLGYSTVCQLNNISVSRLAIISDQFDPLVYHMIQMWELPIEFYVIGQEKLLKLRCHE